MKVTLLARRLGAELDVRADRINGIAWYEWDAATQRRMMANAKAALDIKGNEDDFCQFTKPPTKGQQFIVSGIPFATNTGSPIIQDMLESGFEVADVGDQERWFSHDYWQRTRAFSDVLEERIRPQAVALAYQRCLTEVVGRSYPGAARSSAQIARAPTASKDHGWLAQWHGYAQGWRVLHRLGASWKDTAPHRVKSALETLRTYVPGYVRCKASDFDSERKAISVSILLDLCPQDEGDQANPFPGEIPDRWEIIAFRPLPKMVRAGLRFKSLARWPRRSLLRDRMLAAASADGDYLAFATGCDAGLIAWVAKAVASLEARPQAAMVRRNRDADGDIDSAATFIVRCDVWRALKGYHPGRLLASARCGDFDLVQRIRLLGYEVASASGNAPQLSPNPLASPQSGGNVVVYTAITNRYDRLLALDQRCVKPARQIAFLDEATRSAAASPRNWEIRAIEEHEQDPNRAAKLHKARPDLYFPDAEYSLWIDGNVSLIYPFDLQRLIDLFLADADLCIGRHYARSCIYQEGEACKQRNLDSTGRIDQQMSRYRQQGYPAWYGLNQAVVILRRHTEAVRAFNQLWWQEICQGSRRDQLSFNYVQWKTGLPIGEFPLPIQDNNGLFAKAAHMRGRPVRYAAGPVLRTMINRMEAFHLGAHDEQKSYQSDAA